MRIMPHEMPKRRARDWDAMSFWQIEAATGINAQTLHMRCKRYGISKSKAVALGPPTRHRRPLL